MNICIIRYISSLYTRISNTSATSLALYRSIVPSANNFSLYTNRVPTAITPSVEHNPIRQRIWQHEWRRHCLMKSWVFPGRAPMILLPDGSAWLVSSANCDSFDQLSHSLLRPTILGITTKKMNQGFFLTPTPKTAYAVSVGPFTLGIGRIGAAISHRWTTFRNEK